MASMASVEPAMESKWGGVGWDVSMRSMGNLRGGALYKLAGGLGSGIYPNIHMPISLFPGPTLDKACFAVCVSLVA